MRALAFFVADDVVHDGRDLRLVGRWDTLEAPTLPMSARFFVWLDLAATDAEAGVPFDYVVTLVGDPIEPLRLDGGTPIFPLGDPGHSPEFTFDAGPYHIELPAEGRYAIQFLVDGEILAEREFLVSVVPQS